MYCAIHKKKYVFDIRKKLVGMKKVGRYVKHDKYATCV